MVCDFESLRVGGAGKADGLGENRVSLSLKAGETGKALDGSAVLQSFARDCSGCRQALEP